MAQSEARRQKQLAKKKAKREDKRTHLTRLNSDDPTVRLASAESWPIQACTIPELLWSNGIGACIIARRCPDGRFACASFLVDTYCLGVKNAYWRIVAESEYEDLLRKTKSACGTLKQVTPEHLAKLVYGSVAYAQALGLPPHKDYGHARMLLAGIDSAQCPDIFEFGHEGKPYYVQGPHDSDEKVRTILQRINAAQGHYLISMKGSTLIAPVDEEDDLDQDEGA